MRRFPLFCAIGMLFAFFAMVTPVRADLIDFETQAAGRGGVFTGTADSPLTIGLATFTGGELLNGEVGLPSDQTGVYATQVFTINETNPLVITFAAPVQSFGIFIANGGEAQTYTVTDDVGDTVTRALGSAGSGGSATLTLPGVGISMVQIQGSSDGWNFAVDDVSFAVAAAAPEPGSLPFLLLVGGFAFVAVARISRRP